MNVLIWLNVFEEIVHITKESYLQYNLTALIILEYT